MRLLMTVTLEGAGAAVDAAADLARAIDWLDRAEVPYDLIVADRRLTAGASGVSVLRHAADGRHARATLVLITAQADSTLAAEVDGLDVRVVDKMDVHRLGEMLSSGTP